MLSILLLPKLSVATEPNPETLLEEFQRLRAAAEKLTPDFEVGGYLQGKSYGDHELLWHLETDGSPEVIRIYREKKNGEQAFDITFHHSSAIVKDHMVIRRFIGPAFTGWRNDTVDSESGEYLGFQGARFPHLDARDEEILRSWKVTVFE